MFGVATPGEGDGHAAGAVEIDLLKAGADGGGEPVRVDIAGVSSATRTTGTLCTGST